MGTGAALALAAWSLTVGCGLESAVVGGRCSDGMKLSGNTCVAPAPDTTPTTSSDPPISATGNQLAGAAVAVEDPSRPRNPPQPQPQNPLDPKQPFVPYLPPVPPQLVCTAPLVACRGDCIPVTSDAANCGACGKICPANICIAGDCQGATPGDVVLIGHDYTQAYPGSAQAKVLVNALTIPTTDPIRVLSYEDGASAVAVAQAKSVVLWGIYGRGVRFTRAASASTLTAPTLGRDYDVVLIHDAGAGDASTTGASWSTSLGDFTKKGGVVVALDRGTSPMPELLSSSGLLAVTSHTLLPATAHLVVTAAADVVGAQVLSPYAGFGAPLSFQGVPAQGIDLGWVVRPKDDAGTLGDPIVVHRIVR